MDIVQIVLHFCEDDIWRGGDGDAVGVGVERGHAIEIHGVAINHNQSC